MHYTKKKCYLSITNNQTNNMNNILYVGHILCAIWVIYDVITQQKKMSGGSKALWVILALFFSILTAIIYYFMVKKK